MDIRKDIIDKYLNTKKNRLIAGCVTGLIVLGCGGGIVYATRDTSPKLQLKKNTINLEYGKEFKADFDTLVDTKGLNKEDKEYLKKNLKIKTDIKNDIETVTNEDGTTEEKDRGFAKVGDYKVNLTYKDETKTVKVVVKDTTAPEITAPENIEILQGTDLATFDFKSLITATDLATINELTVDYSTVDINVPAVYTVKASIEDANGNKAEKDVKVTVIAPPAIAEDEVVVQETVTNADGTKTVKNTVKKKVDSSGDKVVISDYRNWDQLEHAHQIVVLIVLETNLQVLLELEEAQEHLVVVLTNLQMEEHLVVTALEEIVVIQVEVLEVDQEILEEILEAEQVQLVEVRM